MKENPSSHHDSTSNSDMSGIRSPIFQYVFPILLGAWGLVLLYFFIKAHPLYIYPFLENTTANQAMVVEKWKALLDPKFSDNFWTLLPIGLMIWIFVSSMLWFLGKKLTPLRTLLLFWIGLSGSLVAHGWEKELFIEKMTFFIAFKTIFFNILWLTLLAALFSIFILSIGHGINRFFLKKPLGLLQRFVLGFIFLGFYGFIMAKLGLFGPWPLLILLGIFLVILLLLWEQCAELLKEIYAVQIKLSVYEIVMAGFLGMVIILNFGQSLFPFPLGWDSLNAYWLNAKTLLGEGATLDHILPPFTEIVLAWGATLSKMDIYPFLINFWGSFLIGTLILFGNQLKIPRWLNLTMAATFFIIPTIQFQLSKDLKIDVLYIQMILMSLIFWMQNHRKLSAFTLGFAFLQKITAVLFFPVFVLLLILEETSPKQKWKILGGMTISGGFLFLVSLIFGSSLSQFTLTSPTVLFFFGELILLGIFFWKTGILTKSKLGAIGLLFLSPAIWGLTNLVQVEKVPTNLIALREVLLKGENPAPVPKLNPNEVQAELQALKSKQEQIAEIDTQVKPKTQDLTGFTEEVSRYAGYAKNPFEKIWNVMTNPGIPKNSHQYVDLGFWWLAILPLLVLVMAYLLITDPRKIPPKHWHLFILSAFFFVFWIWKGEGVAWYGYPAIVILMVVGTKIFSLEKKLAFVWSGILFVSLGMGFVSRMEHSTVNAYNTSISWLVYRYEEGAKQKLMAHYFKDELKATEILNQQPETFVYRIGTMTKYWTKNPDKRLFNDDQLDMFNRMFAEENADITHKRLYYNGFRYILFDLGTASIEKDTNGTLHQKVADFEQFVNEAKLPVLYKGGRLALFKIPQPETSLAP